jgi:hypothetical protein
MTRIKQIDADKGLFLSETLKKSAKIRRIRVIRVPIPPHLDI